MRVTRDVAVPLAEIEVRATRSSGPGGQHANKTASRIEAIFDVRESASLTGAQRARVQARCGPRVVAVAQDSRSQARNRELALERLRSRLASALAVPRTRRKTSRRGPRGPSGCRQSASARRSSASAGGRNADD